MIFASFSDIFVSNSLYPLCDYEIEKAKRFANEDLKHRYLAGRTFLRNALSIELGIGPDQLVFGYTEYGKPYLTHPTESTSLHFNLSHSEEFVCLAICRELCVGVDVEKQRKLPDESALVHRFFHELEKEEYRKLPLSRRTEWFFGAWSSKEAILKAVGCGVSMGLEDIQLTLNLHLEATIKRLESSILGKAANWTLHQFQVDPTHLGAVAVPFPNAKIKISEAPKFTTQIRPSGEPNPNTSTAK